jgi:hypothetical protein
MSQCDCERRSPAPFLPRLRTYQPYANRSTRPEELKLRGKQADRTWTRARRDALSTASTRDSGDTSRDTTVRGSSALASRLPEMLVPPPNGITTAMMMGNTKTPLNSLLI